MSSSTEFGLTCRFSAGRSIPGVMNAGEAEQNKYEIDTLSGLPVSGLFGGNAPGAEPAEEER